MNEERRPEPEEAEAIEVEITDVLDLHSFPPSDIGDLIGHYLEEAADRGLRSLRIIHGRGKGVQRRSVRAILERHPRVRRFGDAPPEAGGWGATWLELE